MRRFFSAHRQLIIGIVVVALLLSAWTWFAGAARQQSSFRRTDERIAQAKTYMKAAFSGDRTSRLSAIDALAKLPTSGTCHGDWWNDWQQKVIPAIQTAAERCRKQEGALKGVIQAAAGVKQYEHDEAGITKQLAGLKVDTTAPDWPLKAKAAAARAAKAINSIRAIPTLEPVQKSAKTHVEAILTAWDALNTASSKQDKDAYLAADAQLKQAYANLAAISDVSDAQLTTVLKRLKTAATAL